MEKNNEEGTKLIVNRLSRIIGQLQAIKRMTEENRECSEILIQISAARSALDSASKTILQNYVNSCIDTAVSKNDVSAVSDLKNVLSKFLS